MCFTRKNAKLTSFNFFTGGRLKITPGVTLKFEHSIGMMIAGEIIAEGDLKGGTTWLLNLLQDLWHTYGIFIFQK